MNRLFKKQQDSSSDRDNNKFISILFNIDSDYNIDIQFYWPDMDAVDTSTLKEIAKNYASLVSIINLGGFKKDIIRILFESQQQTQFQSDKKFLQYVLQYIVELEKIKSESTEDPIVMPSKAFNKKYD